MCIPVGPLSKHGRCCQEKRIRSGCASAAGRPGRWATVFRWSVLRQRTQAGGRCVVVQLVIMKGGDSLDALLSFGRHRTRPGKARFCALLALGEDVVMTPWLVMAAVNKRLRLPVGSTCQRASSPHSRHVIACSGRHAHNARCSFGVVQEKRAPLVQGCRVFHRRWE